MVVPIKKQYEQFCNAAMLKSMGVNVIKKFNLKTVPLVNEKLLGYTIIKVGYPNTEKISNLIIEHQTGKQKLNTQYKVDHYSIFK